MQEGLDNKHTGDSHQGLNGRFKELHLGGELRDSQRPGCCGRYKWRHGPCTLSPGSSRGVANFLTSS